MSSSSKDFRLIKLAQKLYEDICCLQANSEKGFRFTACKDLRDFSKNVIFLIRKANGLDAGSEDRIRLQYDADEFLEKIKDLLPSVCKLVKSGTKREGEIDLAISNLQNPFHNWMERDQKISASEREKVVRKLAWKLYNAKKIYQIINETYENEPSERMAIALDEAKSRYRIAFNNYQKAVESYDEAIRRLRISQDKFHKDDSVLAQVLSELEKRKNIQVPKESFTKDEKPSYDTVKEKKSFESEVNKHIIKTNGESLSLSTIMRLRDNFSK